MLVDNTRENAPRSRKFLINQYFLTDQPSGTLGHDYSFESGGALLNQLMDELRIQRAVLSASCVNCHW